jgi:hypothetical protein
LGEYLTLAHPCQLDSFNCAQEEAGETWRRARARERGRIRVKERESKAPNIFSWWHQSIIWLHPFFFAASRDRATFYHLIKLFSSLLKRVIDY